MRTVPVTNPLQLHESQAAQLPAAALWTLTECLEDGRAGHVFSIQPSVNIVGRMAPATIVINSPGISKQHATIWMENGQPHVRDLCSTNGTFLNGRKIESAVMEVDDLLQFANTVYRVHRPGTQHAHGTIEGQSLTFAETVLEMEQLLSGQGVLPHFQPIITLATREVIGHELLARSRFEQLRNPLAMFTTAARLGQECNLSELMRREGAKEARHHSQCGNLFVNTHPKEIINDRFLDSLYELRGLVPDMPITIEVHESAVTESSSMPRFRQTLTDCRMQLAYDDFGAGQARLHELTEIPPDYLKFDIMLIRDLDRAPERRQVVVASLVRMARELGIVTLAEGVETEGEAQVCRQIGFELAQGYLFGRPAPWRPSQPDA